MDSGDLNRHMADEHFCPFYASLNAQNFYDSHIIQALPFVAGYHNSSDDAFHVQPGLYPSNIHRPGLNQRASWEAFERSRNSKFAAYDMLLQSPFTALDITPLRILEPMNPSMGRNFAPDRGPGSVNTSMPPSIVPPSGTGSMNTSTVPKLAPLRESGSTIAPSVSVGRNQLPGDVKFGSYIKETNPNKPKVPRRKWTKEETQKLIELVGQFGEKNWNQIAEKIPGRKQKQCSERWYNHARPNIKKDKWSEEEENKLIRGHQQFGPRWRKIAKMIPNRAEICIKNHWYGNIRKFHSRSMKTSSILQNYIKSLPAENSPIITSAISTDSSEYSKNFLKNNHCQLGENSDVPGGYAIEKNNLRFQQLNPKVESETLNPNGTYSELG